jgi:uncharacterized protein
VPRERRRALYSHTSAIHEAIDMTRTRRRTFLAISGFALTVAVATALPASAQAPSFPCGKAAPGSIEALICSDAALSALDRRLADVFAAAAKKAANERPPVLRAEQRGWVKGRDECWKSTDRRACVEESYLRRIAELQARYRLVTAIGPVTFACDGDRRNEIVVTFFRTDPPTLIAERGDSVSLMYQVRSASGTKYQGRNESLWEHQGVAQVAWGKGAPEMRCVPASAATVPPSATPAAALMALPVIATQPVAPGDYAGAAAVASRGGAPIEVALAAAGAFEGTTQHAIQENRGAESPAATRVTLLRDGFLDDAVRGDRWAIAMERTAAGGWRIVEVTRAWRCRRSAQQDRFDIAPCP